MKTIAENSLDGTTPIATRRIIFPSALAIPNGIAWNSQGLWVGDNDGDEVFLLPLSNASQTTDQNGTITVTLTDSDVIKRFDLSSLNATIESMTILGTQLVVGDGFDDALYFYDLSTANGATAVIRRLVNLPPSIGDPFGIAAADSESVFVVDLTDDKLYQIPISKANETTHADGYTVVDLLDSDITLQFNLPSGLTNPRSLAFKSSQATLTLSTTDTDIREGEAVDIDIASDVDISDFVASDITVTGGTRGALTENSATSYTLRVTAGSAGTLTVSIAEDAVTPGNAVASKISQSTHAQPRRSPLMIPKANRADPRV